MNDLNGFCYVEQAPNVKFDKTVFARASITKVSDDKAEYVVRVATTDGMHSGSGVISDPLVSAHLRFASEKGRFYYSSWKDLLGKMFEVHIDTPIESGELVITFIHDKECAGQYIGPYLGVGTFEYKSKASNFTWHR